MNLLDRISIKGTVFAFPDNQRSGHLLSLFMNDHSLEEKCFVQKHFIKYFFILLFLLCFVTPVLITFSLNVFITFAVSFLQKTVVNVNVMRQAQNFGQTLSGAKHSSRTRLPPPMAHHGSLSHHVGHHVHKIHLIGHHVPHLVSN